MHTTKKILHLGVSIAMALYMVLPSALLWPVQSANAAYGVADTMAYQGRLKNATTGAAIDDSSVAFIFNLYDAETAGNLLWSETHAAVDVSDGYFAVTLGDTDGFHDGAGEDVDFSKVMWLAVTVEGEAASDRVAIGSMPYAYTARGVESSATAPATNLYGGRMYYNTATGLSYVYDAVAAEWVDLTVRTLDEAYDAFGTAAQVVTIDDAVTGLTFDVTAAGDFVVDLDSTGQFLVTDDTDSTIFGAAAGTDFDFAVYDDDGIGMFTTDGVLNTMVLRSNDGSSDSMLLDADGANGSGIWLDAYHGTTNPTGKITMDAGSQGLDFNSVGDVTLDTSSGSISIVADGAGENLVLQSTQSDVYIGVLGSGGNIQIGSEDLLKTINIGTGGLADTVNIATDNTSTDTVNIGNTGNSTLVTVNGGDGATGGVTLVAGDAAPNAGENGNDITIEAEDDLLIETTDDVDFDVADDFSLDAALFSIDSTETSNLTVTGVGQNLTVAALGGGAQVLTLQSVGTGADAITIVAGNASGGIDVDFGTGNMVITGTGASADFTLDADLLSIDGTGTSNVTVTSNVAGEDFTVALAGATDSSLILSSTGTGADALQINASAGGLDMTAALLNMDLVATVADVNITGNVNVDLVSTTQDVTTTSGDDTIFTVGDDMVANVTGLWDMNVTETATLDALSVSLDATDDSNLTVTGSGKSLTISAAGGGNDQRLTLSSSGSSVSSIDINATGGASGIDIDAGSLIDIASARDNAQAINLSATDGGIDISATTSADTEDIDITTTGVDFGDIDLSSSDDIGLLAADNITLDTTDGSMTFTATGAANGDFTVNAADDITVFASSDGSNLSVRAGDNAAASTADGNDVFVGTEDDLILSVGDDFNLTALDLILTGTETTALNATNEGLTITASDTDADGGGTVGITGNDGVSATATTGTLALAATAGAMTLNAGSTMDLDATTTMSLNTAAAQVINIGNDAVAQSVLLGNAAATEVDAT
ncbi:MAG: hypothetical protein V1664_04070, partial [Candidatus Uhrbacteria bacterium]